MKLSCQKPFIATAVILFCSLISLGQEEAFVTTWKTYGFAINTCNEITIPTEGSGYDYSVDWGDGTSDSNVTGDITHVYALNGTYVVTITGDFPRIYFNSTQEAPKLISIDQWGTQVWQSMEDAFSGCFHMKMNATDTPDLSAVTNMSCCFKACRDLEGDFSQWDVSNVTRMDDLFAATDLFNEDLSSWDVSGVTHMTNMFWNSKTFNQDISSWDVSQVNYMGGMFKGALAFNQDIGGWDVSNVISFDGTFNTAEAFNKDIGAWDVSNATQFSNMFLNAASFNQDLSSWNIGNANTLISMFSASALTSYNYDLILNAWSALPTVPPFMAFGSSATYCDGEPGRIELVDTYDWFISDGGQDCDICGCQDPSACNFNVQATCDGECCEYAIQACESCSGEIDGSGVVLTNDADHDGLCDVDEVSGCTEIVACNYNPLATDDDGSCEFDSCQGCTYESAQNYSPDALIEDGSCIFETVAVCLGDLNQDALVDGSDLVLFLGVFGASCD